MVDLDVFPQHWLYSICDPEGKRVDALSSDGQDNVQQTLVCFHVSYFSKSNAESSQGRVIPTSGLLLQKTSHETVRLTGR